MKVTYTLLATATLFSGLSSAQGALPSCAQGCVTKFTSGSSIGGCSSINIVCICSSSDFLSSIACCLTEVCSPTDQEAAVRYAQNFCDNAGVTNLPSTVSCATKPATAGATSSPSAAVTSAASNAGSSAASSAQSSASSASGSSASAATASQSSAAPSPTNNGSPHNVGGIGAALLGGVAAVAALL